ncbi:MAG: BadF/BadG/BcrA/BcrD ATPase family protein [Erysipelotrichaceae bacterium]
MAVILGLDGGGTKTAVKVWHTEEGCIKKFTLGTSNINQLGSEKFIQLIKRIGKELENLKLESDIAILGIPAYGESIKMDKIIEDAILTHINSKTIKIYNDVEVGHFGSLACEDGINVVSGTGSIAIGIYNEKSIRCGGWGEIIGDEGSGYKIGLATLQTLSKQLDKRNNKTILYELLSDEYDLGSMSNLIDFVYSNENNRTKIASLSRITYKAAEYGCKQSQEILQYAALDLVEHVTTIVKELGIQNKYISVSYSGGTFNAKNYFLTTFINEINKISNIKLIKPILSPIEGTILKGYKVLNVPIDDISVIREEI